MINTLFINNFSKLNILLKPLKQSHKSNVSFTGNIDNIPDSELHEKDLKTFSKPLEQNSWLFRDGLVESLDEIAKSFPDTFDKKTPEHLKPKKFFIYGCSDGHEPYSIIMYLIKKYGSLEEAKKKVELHSIDIPSPGLKMAKSGELDISEEVLDIGYEDIKHQNLRLISEDEHIIQKSLRKKSIKINPDILEYANFQEGRILNDFKPKGNFKETEPVVVFFRNSLPYIKPRIALKFIDNLYMKLSAGSFLGIGNHDHHSSNIEVLNKIHSKFDVVKLKEFLNSSPFLFKKS